MSAGKLLGVSRQLIIEMISLRLRGGPPATLRERLQDQQAILASLFTLGVVDSPSDAMEIIAPIYSELARRSSERSP